MPKKTVGLQVAEKIYAGIAKDTTSAKFGLTLDDVEKLVSRHGSRRLTRLISGGATIHIRTDKENNFTNAVLVGGDGPVVGTAKRNRYAKTADASVPKRGASIALSRLMDEVKS